MKNTLKVGFARVDITPELGIEITGYYKKRIADGVLDNLEVNCVTVSDGKNTAALVSVDHCGINQVFTNKFRAYASETTGIPVEGIFIHSTHTHTGPKLPPVNVADPHSDEFSATDEYSEKYVDFLCHKVSDVIRLAVDDLKPAKMGYAVSEAPNIAFIRRFKMKDGSTATNPGPDNPNIDHPIGEVDERVNVLRFDREGAETVVLVNFGNHPDVIGGNKLSADWPGFLRKKVEKALDNTKCIFFNGVQGDVNHVNVHPRGGDLNDMFLDFDDVMRGYGHSRHIGNVVAGSVLQVYDKVNYVDVDKISFANKIVNVPANSPSPDELPLAHKYNDLHLAGKDDEIPFKAMGLTTAVAKAARIVRLEHGPEFFPMPLSAIKIGNIAFIGLPGEPFTGIGVKLKETQGFDLVLPCCITNGAEGYFPMKDAYDEGGYEAGSSNFKAGVAELLVKEGQDLLKSIK